MNKLIYVCFILFLLFGGGKGYAQKKQHPYLFFTNERVNRLKQRITKDTVISNNWEIILEEADKSLKRESPTDRIEYLSLAYLVTKDNRYASKTKEAINSLLSQSTWTNEEMLERSPAWNSELKGAEKCFAVAIGFDAIYGYLSKSERKKMAEQLVALGVKPALGDWLTGYNRIHSLNSMGHNWWSACVCMAGIASLAVENEEPQAVKWTEKVYEALPQWFGFAGDVLQFKQKTFDDKGGTYESVNYASFGISEALFFRLAWMNAHPDRKPEDISQLHQILNYILHVCYPRTGNLYNLPFGDSGLEVTCERPVKLLYAMGIGDENSLWYINQVKPFQHREGLFVNTPLGIIYQPDMTKAPRVPKYKTSELFTNFGWATMRNSWEKDATMLGVKCGFTWNHSHADANSFVIFHHGVDIIKDAGNCWYGNPLYSEYFFQSEAHNVVRFNGEGQMKEQEYAGSPLRGSLYHLMDGGNIKYVLGDATGPYANNFSRNFRHFLWMDKVIFIIDDLKTHKVGTFEWLWHPGGESKKQGADISVTKGNSSVLIRPLYPETLIKTGFAHDFPEKMQLTAIEAPMAKDLDHKETYYSVKYPEEVRQVKALNAIILKDSPEDKNIPVIEKIQGENWIGIRMKQNSKITELYINQLADGRLMHLNSCLNMNGWETDAYLFAVSYQEGTNPKDSKELFMAYGSYLRNSRNVYFDSLSKLFFIAKEENGILNIQVQGQPIIRAAFRSKKKPVSLRINEKEEKIEFDSKESLVYFKINMERNGN